jgi:hypothetical protein
MYENNLYRKPELNKDASAKPGFFEPNGRVTMLKLRKVISGGATFPISLVAKTFGVDEAQFNEGVEFNRIQGYEHEQDFVKKYTIHRSVSKVSRPPGVKGKQMIHVHRKIEAHEWAFHTSTTNLGKVPVAIQPDRLIWISEKGHGKNMVAEKRRVQRRLNAKERLVQKLFKVSVDNKEIELIYSSRAVLKNHTQHYEHWIRKIFGKLFEYLPGKWRRTAEFRYPPVMRNNRFGSDEFGVQARQLDTRLPEGFGVVGEVLGYTPKGSPVQKHYNYNCLPCESILKVFRVYTITGGRRTILSYPQAQKFCDEHGINMVDTHYYGLAKDLFPDIPLDENWNRTFMRRASERFLEKEIKFQDGTKVANEGVVITVERDGQFSNYKLKSPTFNLKEAQSETAGLSEDEQTGEEETIA